MIENMSLLNGTGQKTNYFHNKKALISSALASTSSKVSQ
jgi:hypothetical protein